MRGKAGEFGPSDHQDVIGYGLLRPLESASQLTNMFGGVIPTAIAYTSRYLIRADLEEALINADKCNDPRTRRLYFVGGHSTEFASPGLDSEGGSTFNRGISVLEGRH